MNFFKTSICVFCCAHALLGNAQSLVDSIKQLKPVEISSLRLNEFSSGNKCETIDSAMLNKYATSNLADVLTNETQVFVKSYGLGSLATTSFRGAGASHTAVLWNGFNIESPMLGLLDISLIPSFFLNDVRLQYGGAGALWGSGAVGGTILLNNALPFNRGLTVSAMASMGSYNDAQQQASVEVSKRKFASSLKIFNHQATNDFTFTNIAKRGFPEEKQTNAELKAYGILQENLFQISSHQKLNTRIWYQNNDRNLPPSMTEDKSVANQKDDALRASTEWQRTGERVALLARVAYFNEGINYTDSMIHLQSKSRSEVTIAEAESRFSITKLDAVNIGFNNTYSQASTLDYGVNKYQNRTALFASYKLHTKNNNWNVLLSARQEFIKNTSIPFSPTIGVDGKFLKYFYVKMNIAKHYRIPTFNDLYWAQGGNPDLKPENGWSEEISLNHQHEIKSWSWYLGASVFNRTIDNWILWSPNAANVWSAGNVASVWSRGVEYKLNATYTFKKLKVKLSGLYNYVLSTNESSAIVGDASLHKQLMYVPIQNAQGSISIGYRHFSVSYTTIYAGYRYTSTDNLVFLKPYSVSNVSLNQLILLKKWSFRIFVQLNNVWNQTYQVMQYRAMPLLNAQAGVGIYFNKPNKP